MPEDYAWVREGSHAPRQPCHTPSACPGLRPPLPPPHCLQDLWSGERLGPAFRGSFMFQGARIFRVSRSRVGACCTAIELPMRAQVHRLPASPVLRMHLLLLPQPHTHTSAYHHAGCAIYAREPPWARQRLRDHAGRWVAGVWVVVQACSASGLASASEDQYATYNVAQYVACIPRMPHMGRTLLLPQCPCNPGVSAGGVGALRMSTEVRHGKV